MDTGGPYVVDVMTSQPVMIGPDEAAWRADRLASEHGVHYLLVADAYALVGVVCRCDLQRSGVGEQVGSCVTRAPVTVDDQATVEQAAERMEREHVGCLPVVDWAGMVRGVVTRHDLPAPLDGAPRCASCGTTHGLPASPGAAEPVFCRLCTGDRREKRASSDDLFVTLGGGG